MRFKKKRDYRDSQRPSIGTPGEKRIYLRFDLWVDLSLKGAALLGIGKDLRRDAPPLGWIRDELMDDVVGVDGLEAELPQKPRGERLPAGDSARQRNSPHFDVVSR